MRYLCSYLYSYAVRGDMTSTALYSLTDTNDPQKKPLHFLFQSDSTRPDAAGVIEDLAGVACRIWKGEAVDLSRLGLPHVDYVMRKETRGDAGRYRPVPVRYDVEVVNGVVVHVQELRHAPQGLPELEERRQRAEETLALVVEEMKIARLARTYQVSVSGNLEALRKKLQSRE
jgi:hypothetical protein